MVMVLVFGDSRGSGDGGKRPADCGLCGEAGKIRPKEETKRIRVRKSRKSADLG